MTTTVCEAVAAVDVGGIDRVLDRVGARAAAQIRSLRSR